MADESDPPRVFYQLKPREFERVNAIPGESSSSAAPSAAEGSVPNAPGRIEIQDLYQQAAVPGPALPRTEKNEPKNEVHVILKDNLNHANAAGLNTLAPKPRRRSKRTRDFIVVVVPLNAFFGFAAFGPYANPMSMVYGVAGMIFSTIGIGWVMFFVMDDY